VDKKERPVNGPTAGGFPKGEVKSDGTTVPVRRGDALSKKAGIVGAVAPHTGTENEGAVAPGAVVAGNEEKMKFAPVNAGVGQVNVTGHADCLLL
jgi:hypothetical protein